VWKWDKHRNRRAVRRAATIDSQGARIPTFHDGTARTMKTNITNRAPSRRPASAHERLIPAIEPMENPSRIYTKVQPARISLQCGGDASSPSTIFRSIAKTIVNAINGKGLREMIEGVRLTQTQYLTVAVRASWLWSSSTRVPNMDKRPQGAGRSMRAGSGSKLYTGSAVSAAAVPAHLRRRATFPLGFLLRGSNAGRLIGGRLRDDGQEGRTTLMPRFFSCSCRTGAGGGGRGALAEAGLRHPKAARRVNQSASSASATIGTWPPGSESRSAASKANQCQRFGPHAVDRLSRAAGTDRRVRFEITREIFLRQIHQNK